MKKIIKFDEAILGFYSIEQIRKDWGPPTATKGDIEKRCKIFKDKSKKILQVTSVEFPVICPDRD